jgi:hypothetical protein
MLQYIITIIIPINRGYFIAKSTRTMSSKGDLSIGYIWATQQRFKHKSYSNAHRQAWVPLQAFFPIRLRSRLCVHFELEGLISTYRVEGQMARHLPAYLTTRNTILQRCNAMASQGEACSAV